MDFVSTHGPSYIAPKPPRIVRFRAWLARLIAGGPEPQWELTSIVEDELYDARVALLHAFNELERWTNTVTMLEARCGRLVQQQQEFKQYEQNDN